MWLSSQFFVWEQSILANLCAYRFWTRSPCKQGGRMIYKGMLRKKNLGATPTQKKPSNWTVSKTELRRKRCFGTFATLMQKKHSDWTLSKSEFRRKVRFGTFATGRCSGSLCGADHVTPLLGFRRLVLKPLSSEPRSI